MQAANNGGGWGVCKRDFRIARLAAHRSQLTAGTSNRFATGNRRSSALELSPVLDRADYTTLTVQAMDWRILAEGLALSPIQQRRIAATTYHACADELAAVIGKHKERASNLPLEPAKPCKSVANCLAALETSLSRHPAAVAFGYSGRGSGDRQHQRRSA
jgi:hypothetical protein